MRIIYAATRRNVHRTLLRNLPIAWHRSETKIVCRLWCWPANCFMVSQSVRFYWPSTAGLHVTNTFNCRLIVMWFMRSKCSRVFSSNLWSSGWLYLHLFVSLLLNFPLFLSKLNWGRKKCHSSALPSAPRLHFMSNPHRIFSTCTFSVLRQHHRKQVPGTSRLYLLIRRISPSIHIAK